MDFALGSVVGGVLVGLFWAFHSYIYGAAKAELAKVGDAIRSDVKNIVSDAKQKL